MGRLRWVLVPAVSCTAAAPCLWALAVLATWPGLDRRGLAIETAAAATSTVAAALCWLVRRQGWRDDVRLAELAAEYQRREAVLIRTISRLGGDPTGPMPCLRAVPAQAALPRRRP
jgi:hypothetical protein